jgi:hypothetical protein
MKKDDNISNEDMKSKASLNIIELVMFNSYMKGFSYGNILYWSRCA